MNVLQKVSNDVDTACITVLRRLYESDIDYAIRAVHDAGWEVEISGSDGPSRSSGHPSLADAISWLATEAQRLYPESVFADWLKS